MALTRVTLVGRAFYNSTQTTSIILILATNQSQWSFQLLKSMPKILKYQHERLVKFWRIEAQKLVYGFQNSHFQLLYVKTWKLLKTSGLSENCSSRIFASWLALYGVPSKKYGSALTNHTNLTVRSQQSNVLKAIKTKSERWTSSMKEIFYSSLPKKENMI